MITHSPSAICPGAVSAVEGVRLLKSDFNLPSRRLFNEGALLAKLIDHATSHTDPAFLHELHDFRSHDHVFEKLLHHTIEALFLLEQQPTVPFFTRPFMIRRSITFSPLVPQPHRIDTSPG